MDLELSAEIRSKNEKLDNKFLAGVLYGKGVETRSLKFNYNDFVKLFEEAGESNLINLNLGDQVIPVLIKETQKDALKNTFIHADFYQVNMKEKVKTEIPLEFIGESKAVKELGGVFIANIDAIAVECLPGDLVDHIDVDISALTEFGDVIRLHEIKVPKGMELMHESNEVICGVEEPKKVEEEPVAAPAAEAAKAGAEAKPAAAEKK